MISILTIGSEFESAQRLGWPTSIYHKEYLSNYKADEIVIRWGNSSPLYDKDGNGLDFPNVVNPASAIAFNCEKNLALEAISKVVLTPTQYKEKVPSGIQAVVRGTSHSGGKGFNVMKGPVKIADWQYATKFIRTKTEYRVWFCGDKTLCAKRVTKKAVKYPYCRSTWAYRFCKITKELHEQTLKAARAIGLECGASDVLSYRGKYYFLENNSAPTVDHRLIKNFYRGALPILVRKKWPKAVIPAFSEDY